MENKNDMSFDEARAAILRLVDEYYADAEVMKAWGVGRYCRADTGRAVRRLLTKPRMKLRVNYPEEARLLFYAARIARQIAEGDFSSPSDPRVQIYLQTFKGDHIERRQ